MANDQWQMTPMPLRLSPVTIARPDDLPDVDAYALAHPRATVYHRPVFARIVHRAGGLPVATFIAWSARGRRVRGILPVALTRSVLFGAFATSLPYFNYGGVLADGFNAGLADGTTTNAEVNVSGGIIGAFFNANPGSDVIVTGGNVGVGFDALGGSRVRIAGGTLSAGFNALLDSNVLISGGTVSELDAHVTIDVYIAGGSVGRANAHSQSHVHLFGTEFILDGTSVAFANFGQAVVIDLAGSTPTEMLVGPRAAMIVNLGARGAGGGSRAGIVARLRQVLDDARQYQLRRGEYNQARMQPLAAPAADLAALQPVLAGTLPVIMIAENHTDITAALRQVNPDDPVRYDFSLCHVGMMNACRFGRATQHDHCPLRGFCNPRNVKGGPEA